MVIKTRTRRGVIKGSTRTCRAAPQSSAEVTYTAISTRLGDIGERSIFAAPTRGGGAVNAGEKKAAAKYERHRARRASPRASGIAACVENEINIMAAARHARRAKARAARTRCLR